MKKISIILPMYNVERYIEKCILSIEDQDINKNLYEVLVIDDGSFDNSRKIVKKLQEKYSNISMYHKTNGGQSSARNYGIERAVGEYCWFIDADDYIEKNILKKLLYELDTYRLDYLGFNIYDIRDGKKEKGIGWIKKSSPIITGTQYIKSTSINMSPCAYILRTKIYQNLNLRFIDGVIHEDYEFTLRMYKFCDRMKFLEYPIYNYVIRDSGSTTSLKTYTQNRYSVYSWKKIIDILENNYKAISDEYSYYAHYWTNTYKYIALTNLLVRHLPWKEKIEFYYQYKSSGFFIIGPNHLSFKRKIRLWIYHIPFIYITLLYLFNKKHN